MECRIGYLTLERVRMKQEEADNNNLKERRRHARTNEKTPNDGTNVACSRQYQADTIEIVINIHLNDTIYQAQHGNNILLMK